MASQTVWLSGLMAAGLAVSGGAAMAQSIVPESLPGTNQSEWLTTQPAGVRSPADPASPDGISPYSAEQLNTVSGSFQVKPKKAGDSIIPSSLMPSDAANAESRARNVNPIDFFQVPPLDSGVKLNISQ